MGWASKAEGATPFGDRLKKERNRRGFTNVNKFANLVGISACSITAMENRGAYPRIPTLIKICQLLECSTDWLLGLEE